MTIGPSAVLLLAFLGLIASVCAIYGVQRLVSKTNGPRFRGPHE